MLECEGDVAKIKDKIVTEQLVSTLPSAVRVYVRERKPSSSQAAGELADDYTQARGGTLNYYGTTERANNQERANNGQERRCHNCGKTGHLNKDCPTTNGTSEVEQRKSNNKPIRPKKDLKDIECYNCRGKGHYSTNCPHNALFCKPRDRMLGGEQYHSVTRTGVVEGNPVSDILLDTGCSRTLIHRSLVPEQNILEGRAVTICCAHGDTVLYPLAEVLIEVSGRQIQVEAAVADRLPVGVLLGTDIPKLEELLMDRKEEDTAAMTYPQGSP